MAKVTAKPLIGPVPIANKINATIKVVSCASKILVNARLKPATIADFGLAPLASSSRMRSNISTLASTAIPMVNTIPAIPGKVSAEPINDMMAKIIIKLKINAILAIKPNKR